MDGYLVLEAGLPPTPADLESAYRSFAVACVEGKAGRALIKIGSAEAAGERALRDAFTVILLAGTGFGFRLALVAGTPDIRSRYRQAQGDLVLTGVEARLFESEPEAVGWLANPGAKARTAAGTTTA